MKCLKRNMQTFYYAPYQGNEPIMDEWGNLTGEYKISYGDPVVVEANISAAKGETLTRQFGENEVYDKVIVMTADAPPIDEYSILWVDSVPKIDDDGKLLLDGDGNIVTPHDYLVRKVAKSLNVISFAISKVTVS